MGFMSKKRLLLTAGGMTTVAAAGMLVAGTTFGLFSAVSTSQSGTFTAGTVTLSQPAAMTCTIGPLVPGDNTGTCAFDVTYGGNVSANLALDVTTAGTGGTSPTTPQYSGTPDYASGAPALFDGTAHGLQLTVKDGTTTLVNGVSYKDTTGTSKDLQGGTPPLANGSGAASGGVNDLLLSSAEAPSGPAHHIVVSWSLPSAADNSYQAATSTLTLLVHAAQSSHNSAAACTVGNQCTASLWS